MTETLTTPTGGRTALSGGMAVTPRPLSAYRDMFLLTDRELTAGPILDCPSGASPFGAQVRELGGQVVGVDPAYAEPDGLVARARADLDRIDAWMRSAPDGFDWDYLGSPEAVVRSWAEAIDVFADDVACDAGSGSAGSRYVAASLPSLPFPDGHFATAVSGFLLFVYPDLLDHAAHRDALLELTRVTRGEVRVFPLHDTAGRPCPTLGQLRSELAGLGVSSEVRRAGCAYQSAPGADRMLVCRRRG